MLPRIVPESKEKTNGGSRDEQIASIKKAIETARAEGADAIVEGLLQQLDAVVTPSSSFSQGPSTRGGRRGRAAGGGAVELAPISIESYPVDDAAPAGAKAGKAYADGFQQSLQRYLVKGQAASHIEGLSDDFAERMSAFLNAAPGGGISIFSGHRSFERQAQLYAEAVKKYGSEQEARKWVAPPGKSQHNKGNAADLRFANDSAKSWAHENASVYGLNFRMGHEPWHIEMADGATTATGAVSGLSDAWEDLRVSVADTSGVEAQASAYDAFGAVATTAIDGIVNALADGKITGQELLGIVADIAKQLLSMPAQQGGIGAGGGGNLIGTVLGGLFGFAKGGVAAYGKPLRTFSKGGVSNTAAIFGEAGPEAAVPLEGGRAIPVNLRMPRPPQVPGRPAAPAAPQPVTIAVQIDGANGDDHVRSLVAQGVRQGLGEYDKTLNGSFGKRMNMAQRRQM